ncbi:MAG: YbaY family lipoprotein [Parcubacteria group bacterium]
MSKKIIFGIIAGLIIIALAVYAIKIWEPSPSVRESSAELTGTVSYRENITLSAGSRVEVEIRDVSNETAPAETVAAMDIVTKGENIPISFAIKYNPENILPDRIYTILARIFIDDELKWITDTPIFFLEEGVPIKNVELILVANDTSTISGVTSADLEGKTFRISSLNGVATDSDYDYTVEFRGNTIYANVCNSMFGGFTLINGTLRGGLASTLMFCVEPAERMGVEDALKSLLRVGADVALSGDILTLSGDGQTLVLMQVQ